MIIELLFASFAFAKDVCLKDNCDELSEAKPKIERETSENQKSSAENQQNVNGKPTDLSDIAQKNRKKFNSAAQDKKTRLYVVPGAESNLPDYFRNLPANSEHQFVFTPKSEANAVIPGFDRGARIKIVIRQSIKASPNVPSPVVGEVISDSFKGSYVYGEATLEGDLKRVIFRFSSLGGGHLESHYAIKGSGVDPQGRVGYEGRYHAEDWKYGIASFFSTGAAIAIDSQVERSQTSTGGYAEAPSASNAVKKGVAGSLGRVAERMADRAEKVPGFTEIEGPIYMTLVLEEKPKVTR
jgi:hypothetical protein